MRAAGDAMRSDTPALSLFSGIRRLIRRASLAGLRDRFLLDPTFIEGLHDSAGSSPSLAQWHRHTTEPDVSEFPDGVEHLGNSLLELLLRVDPYWRGQVPLQTDSSGRLRFPLCDWSIALWTQGAGQAAALACEGVTCSLTRHDVRLALRRRPHETLLVMPRRIWLRLLVGNDDRLDGREIQYVPGAVGMRFDFATEIPGWRVRYDPVGIRDVEHHAGLTGGIVLAAMNAIAHHAPGVAAELDALISSVRCWDLAASPAGTIQSFSDPSLPRVMGINVPYTRSGQPQLCPFCFTWFGHELGHTKSYLIETILHTLGHSLTVQQGGFTEIIRCYGRRLPVRTLLQIPYTHLYEWILMIQFMEGDCAELPWAISRDPVAHADAIRLEIEEAFDRIGRDVPLSPAGNAALARLHDLYGQIQHRWQTSRGRVACV